MIRHYGFESSWETNIKKTKMSAKSLFDFDTLLQDFRGPTFHLMGNEVFAGFSIGTKMESKNPSVTKLLLK